MTTSITLHCINKYYVPLSIMSYMHYDGKILCPYCQHDGNDFNILKEWVHGTQLVNRVECQACKGIFRFYWGKRKDNSDFGYTIKIK